MDWYEPGLRNRWCRGQIARFNAIFAPGYNQLARDWIACHELGHTVGLRHIVNNATCMDYYSEDGVVEMYPETLDLMSLCGILRPKKRGVSLDDMQAAISSEAAGK